MTLPCHHRIIRSVNLYTIDENLYINGLGNERMVKFVGPQGRIRHGRGAW